MGTTGDAATSSKKSEKRKRRRRSRSASPTPASASASSHRRAHQQQSEEPPGAVISSGSGEVVSLSIEETNKLRAKLGLKPLELDTPSGADSKAKPAGSSSSSFVHAPAKSLTKARQSAKVQERTLIGRQRREMRDRLTRLRGLGDDSDDADGDDKDLSAAAWTQRSRDLEAERRLAEQRAKELAALDAEFDVSRLVEADAAASSAAGYSSSDLAGLRVAHSAKQFKEGQTAVLVLQDRGVLDVDDAADGGADAVGETLINVNMVDDERHAANVRNRAQVGSAWHAANAGQEAAGGFDSDEDEVPPGGAGVLAKYDSVIGGDSAPRKRAFVLTGGSMEAPAPSAAAAARAAAAAASVSLDGPSVPRQSADFLTPAEMAEAAKFKRRKRKVAKSRMLKADDLLPLADDEAGGAAQPAEDGELPNDDAVSKPGLTDAEIIEQTPAVADEALEDLQLLLERARRVQQQGGDAAARQQRRQLRPEFRVAEAMEAADASAGGGMVFDTTSEFCRSLGDASAAAAAAAAAALAEARAAAEAASAEEAQDLQDAGDHDDAEGGEDFSIYGRRKQVGTWKEVAETASQQQQQQQQQQQLHRRRTADDEDGMDVSDAEDTAASAGGGGGAGGILEEEPELRKGGVAAALELARRKGYLQADAGRRDPGGAGASQVSGLRAKQVYREDLRHDDIDAKFGRRDRLSLGGGGGAGGGVQEFKELRNYRPDVKLEYTDDDGRLLNQKDAFDYLSHRFHGKGSGKKKTEKRLKKIKEEELLKSMGSSDTPLGTAEKLHAKLERQGTAFVCLSGRGAAASLPSGVSK